MIELKEWQLLLMQKMEIANCSKYITIFENRYYLKLEDMFYCIEDTQENREYAEDKVSELCDELNNRPEDCNSLQLNTMLECKRLKQENEELQQLVDNIRNTLNEDDYDKLAMEGIEL